jgi:kinesin family member 6/9
MMGNYIRKVSCTNLNETSSRSHCIFTLNIKGTFLNEDSLVEVYSKINLVDLAGSERVSKSHAQGIVLT